MDKFRKLLVIGLLASGGAGVLLLLATLLPGSTAVVLAELPPRPTPEIDIVGDDNETGGFIEVVIPDAPDSVWTVVEWQDGEGVWHEVTGWRDGLADVDSRRWWVGPENFGTGPYRWVIYDGPEGTLLATSDWFDMPPQPRALVRAVVNLTDLE